jgi:hypothetical protein
MQRVSKRWLWCGLFLIAGLAAGELRAEEPKVGIPEIVNGTIGYVLTTKYVAVYTTKEGKECPTGLNIGPREQFEVLFPRNGEKRQATATSLAREAEIWFPTTAPDPFEFKQPQSKISYGLNLDGKEGANDFVSPDGMRGIDNQLYRVVGCTANYRGPDGFNYEQMNSKLEKLIYNRTLIEITGVDDLTNDNDVVVTTYRGIDGLPKDAAGAYASGSTQRIDGRWSKKFIQQFRGRIVNGVLSTEAKDLYLPESYGQGNTSATLTRDMRFELKLTSTSAEGLMAGYVDVDSFHYFMAQTRSTHHFAAGQDSPISRYKVMRRLADAYPDPKTGQNTAISHALQVKFSQAFLRHPPKVNASKREKLKELANLEKQ